MSKNGTGRLTVRDAIDESGVPALIRSSRMRVVVVLERRARAAGDTAWFACRSERELDTIVNELHPGSCVSFYFDERFSVATFSSRDRGELTRIIEATGDVVIGRLDLDDIHVEMEIISDADELEDYLATLGSATLICFGAFPARENDGVGAVTLTLPDADGVLREHPH